MPENDGSAELDVLIVGAGFGGIHMLQRAKAEGFTARALERGAGIGGTWYWNRYPGARCDFDSFDYSYEFDPELEQEWTWSERYPSQPEILRYLDHVVDRYRLRDDIRLETTVTAASWDEERARWTATAQGPDGEETLGARFLVLATGALSLPRIPDIEGLDAFAGEVLSTAAWPEQPPELAGRRVAVIGTGSSGVQVVPPIADVAERLTVLQRTPSYVVPARNHPVSAEAYARILAEAGPRRARAREGFLGVDFPAAGPSAKAASPAERERAFQERWDLGGSAILGSYFDLLMDRESNDLLVDWLKAKARAIVHDPETAAVLTSQDYPVGARRIVIDTDYYDTFNREHVDLVDLRREPIRRFVPEGVVVGDERLIPLDAVVFATGFDALTGPILRIDLRGRDGRSLAEEWADGPVANLGVQVAGFPNLFLISGPLSPSVMANVVKAIEQHVGWLGDLLAHARDEGVELIETEPEPQAAWVEQVREIAAGTLLMAGDSWYLGANVPGKPRGFLAYVGGIPAYRQALADVADSGYRGFVLGRRQAAG
ncbi:MAG: cyclohexanone monooxygenase [Micrococcales bacterium 73-13]|nr:MAG: cyclohexanone monooxygenase [Micrococcales bacterium 73-13]